MLTGQLLTGVVKIVAPRTEEILGYAFTEASGAGQLQRWILYRDPLNTFDIVPAPADKQRWTLGDWQANVPSLWRPNAFYVWAQTDVYQYGGVYFDVRWDQIPSELPMPTYPRQGGNYQLDPTGLCPQVLQWDTGQWGFVYVEGGISKAQSSTSGQAGSSEYWFLPGGFQPAGAGTRTSISQSTLPATSLESFVQQANRRWGPGAALAITGCKNYFGALAPSDV